jgi:hypothetical protein
VVNHVGLGNELAYECGVGDGAVDGS